MTGNTISVKECAEKFGFNEKYVKNWVYSGSVVSYVDENGVRQITFKSLAAFFKRKLGGKRGKYRKRITIVDDMETLYHYVLERENSYYQDIDQIGMDILCRRGCEHIHRLRDCNYD